MVATHPETRMIVGADGTVSISEEILSEIGAKPGDTISIAVDPEHGLRLRRVMTVHEMDGIFSLKPGVHADPDFGNVIREATEEYADRIVAQMKHQRVPE